MNDNTGHGHVWERPDGVKMRCGGPAMCKVCAFDLARLQLKSEPCIDYPDPDTVKNGDVVSTTKAET
jgi:hypothetical protein